MDPLTPIDENSSLHLSNSGISDPYDQSFIVKIWITKSVGENDQIEWRGHITRVSSGERQHVKSLDEITNYFKTCLIFMCIEGKDEAYTNADNKPKSDKTNTS